MVTLKDVALKAGVSPSTASAALRGLDIVKPETSQRVLKTAEKLNYQINLAARSLRSGRSDTFSLIVPDLETNYYARLANSMASELSNHGLRLVVQLSRYIKERELEQIRQLNAANCDGLFVCSVASTGKDIAKVAGNIPVLLFDDMSGPSEQCFDSIETPSQTGSFTAIRHLIDCGRERIAIVGATPHELDTAPSLGATLRQNRHHFALQALREYGRPTQDVLITSDWSIEAGKQAAYDLVERGIPFDALYCMNDETALGVIRGFAECGVNVPDDVAVIGFDGINPGTYTTPTLSTIAIDFAGMAQTALTMMQNQISLRESDAENQTMPRRVIVGYQLMKRESTMGRTATTGFTTRSR